MTEWTRERGEDQKKGPEPHPDCNANVNELNRIMKSSWMPSCDWEGYDVEDDTPFGSWEISDRSVENIFDPTTGKNEVISRILEYKNVTFVWGRKRRFKRSHPASFHQKRYDFSDELRSVLNTIKNELR